MDFEETRLYYSHQQLHQPQTTTNNQNDTTVVTPNNSNNNNYEYENDDSQVPIEMVQRHFREFLRNYRIGGVSRYIYREKLIRMHRRLSQQQEQFHSFEEMQIQHQQQQLQGTNDNNTIETATAQHQYQQQVTSRTAKIQVDMAHIGEYDPTLLGYIREFPAKMLPCLESAAVDALSSLLYEMKSNGNGQQGLDPSESQDMMDVDENGQTTTRTTNTNNNNNNIDDVTSTMMLHGLQIQVLLWGTNMKTTLLRSIQSEHMNKLIKCSGIAISTSTLRTRAVQLSIRCPKCQDTRKVIATDGPFGTIRLPNKCYSNGGGGGGPGQQDCGSFPYVTVPDESIFIDQQTLKLQETPERVPTGEMPRSVLLAVERSLVDLAPPGTRISIMCIPTMFTYGGGGGGKTSSATTLSKAVYLRVVGMKKDTNAHGGGSSDGITFTANEEEAFNTLAKRHDVYDILYRSIAPDIQGSYTIDIKKALLCQLFSGSRKKLPDGVTLRGDINVLLLGDPSMAKSQFLKFISKVTPIGIYTSGKGSSAAGLTASIIKDNKGEFYIEGGAMVLADGGIVCIDEFDKMRTNDRVAIHEAMEQQTISIAKAGITTILNSRSSVLAAANPVYGTYDENKTSTENIDLMSTILSRFDMIFLIRDIREEERDKIICQHVMGVHISNSLASFRGNGNDFLGHVLGGTSASDAADGGLYLASSTSTARSMHHDGTNDDDNNDDANNDGSNGGGGGGSGNGSNSTPDAIAEHVMKIATTGIGELNIPSMKKYIQYCKIKCSSPRLSDDAGEVLTSSYVKIRHDMKQHKQSSYTNSGGSGNNTSSSNHDQTAIPITVRQLEALVRISESLAKLRMDPIVRTEDVSEAIRLFKVSTMAASSIDQQHHPTTSSNSSNSGGSNNNNGNTNNVLGLLSGIGNNNRNEMDRTELFLRNRLRVGTGTLVNRLKIIEEGVGLGYNAMIVAKCISIMVNRGEILERNKGRLIKRIK